MNEIQRDILQRIGNTSLLALRNIVPANGARILLKLESENPTGSMKDRMALAMIEAAEADGRLAAGGSVVEYTGGSTGVSARRYRRSDRTSLDGGRDRNVATARTRGGSLCRNVNRRQCSRRPATRSRARFRVDDRHRHVRHRNEVPPHVWRQTRGLIPDAKRLDSKST
jgi:hypothetical protein